VVKKKVKKRNKEQDKASSTPIKVVLEKEEQFDFGGLPKIDLKKNLGCG
jgi:hypothetical protein